MFKHIYSISFGPGKVMKKLSWTTSEMRRLTDYFEFVLKK